MEILSDNKTCKVTVWDKFSTWIYTSRGCRFRRTGSCIMCNYGEGETLRPLEAYRTTRRNVKSLDGKVTAVLIGSYGSILDPYEVPTICLRAICLALAKSHIPTIIFETHYTTITDKILRNLKRWLPGKDIVIEMGFESASERSRKTIRKSIDDFGLFRRMEMIHDHGMEVILNVLVGIPKLTPSEQLTDAVMSVKTAFFRGADEVTLFPMNIKPFTELTTKYLHHMYSPPSSWILIEVLNRLEPRLLGRVSFSWYGDRQYHGECTDVIPPRTCLVCKTPLHEFFTEWNSHRDQKYRETLLESINHTCSCKCRLLYEEEPS